MIRSVYNAGMGLLTLQKEQESISNNMANVQTPAYKQNQMIKEASFAKTLVNHTGPGPRSRTLGKMYLGTSISSQHTDFDQGLLVETNNPLDTALEGPGFFQVQTPAGIELTRNGRFHIDTQGVLVDQGNRPLLAYGENDQLGEVVLSDIKDLSIDRSGNMQGADGRNYRLSIVETIDLEAIEVLSEGYYRAPLAALEAAGDTQVQQGFYEKANVDVVDAMVALMENQRLTQMNGQVFNTLDETLQKAVNEIGRV